MKKEIREVKQIDWFDDHFYKIRYITEAKVERTDYFPSTTTKLGALNKPFLIQWYGDLGTREALRRRDEASLKGTRVHWAWYTYTTHGAVIYQNPKTPLYTVEEMAELKKKYNNDVCVLTNQEEMYDMMKLERMMDILKPTIIASEVIVYDLANREAGTVDNIFEIEGGEYPVNGKTPLVLPGGKYIFDLKTGKSVGKEARMQIADYAHMSTTQYGNITGGLIGHTQSKNKGGIEGLGLIHLNKTHLKEEYQDYRDIAKVWDRNFGNRKPVVRQIKGLITL